jgi:hypothetical protein
MLQDEMKKKYFFREGKNHNVLYSIKIQSKIIIVDFHDERGHVEGER